MPDFNRRTFLQVAGAAGLAPALPGFSASGATAAKGLTNAQKLWVSLYANAEKTATLPSLVRSMGISAEAAQGVYARLIQTQVIASHAAVRVAQTTTRSSVATPMTEPVAKPAAIKVDVQKLAKKTLKLGEDNKDAGPEDIESSDDQT